MNTRRSRVMDVAHREPPPLDKSASMQNDSSSPDQKLSPTLLLQASQRILQQQQQQLEQSPSEASFSYNGGCAVKSDELHATSSWHCSGSAGGGGGGGGIASASESTRESDDGGDAMEQGASASEGRTGGGGRHVCTVCGTSFTMLGNLNRHKKSHMNVRPYNCNFCTRGFLRRTSYVEHVRLHTGEKPYSCAACGQSFVRKKCFQTHAKCCPGSADAGLDLPQSADGGAPAVGSGDYVTVAVPMLAPLADGRCSAGAAATSLVDVLGRPAAAAAAAAADIAAEPGVVRQHATTASAVVSGTSSSALHGGRYFGTAKSLARHQPGIGRTSFSIMKKARSTQLSRWKKQHLGGMGRQLPASAGASQGGSAAVTAARTASCSSSGGGSGLLSRRAVVEGHRRPALHMQLDRLDGGDKPSEHQVQLPPQQQQLLLLQSGEAATRSAGGSTSTPGLSPSRVSAAGGALSSQSACCPATAAAAGEQLSCSGIASAAGCRSVSPAAVAVATAAAPPLQGLLCSPSATTAAAATVPQRSPSTGAVVGMSTVLASAAVASAQPLLQSIGSVGSSALGLGRAASPAAAAGRSPANSADPATPLASLPRDAKLFHCRHCDIYFANLVTFLLHRGLHGEGDPLKCSICGKVCRDANEFLIHH